jgi:hypothetical protein
MDKIWTKKVKQKSYFSGFIFAENVFWIESKKSPRKPDREDGDARTGNEQQKGITESVWKAQASMQP